MITTKMMAVWIEIIKANVGNTKNVISTLKLHERTANNKIE